MIKEFKGSEILKKVLLNDRKEYWGIALRNIKVVRLNQIKWGVRDNECGPLSLSYQITLSMRSPI